MVNVYVRDKRAVKVKTDRLCCGEVLVDADHDADDDDDVDNYDSCRFLR